MGKLEESLDFLKDDLEKAKKQWESSEQIMSLLQREYTSFDELIQKFDPSEDENKWSSEYNNEKKLPTLILYRKRMAFLKAASKEFKEEYDDKITDCDYMRLLEVPFTDPKYVIEYSKSELKEP